MWHPDFLLQALSSRQLSEWMAYFSLEPWGERADWLRTGVLAATVANVHRGKRGRTFTPEDFMPQEPSATIARKQTTAEQKGALRQIFAWAKKKGLSKQRSK